MKLKLVVVALLSASFAVPAMAGPVVAPAPLGIEAHGDVVLVASKRKKKKQVRRNPRNGDVLIGRVDGFVKPDWRNARREREGRDLGGLLGEATNNFMAGRVYSGGGGRRTGPHERPMGTEGQNCGPQYWTDTPGSSPNC